MLYIFLYLLISAICYHLISSNKEGKDGWLIGIFLLLALIVGMADMLGGYDRYIYCELFDGNATINIKTIVDFAHFFCGRK